MFLHVDEEELHTTSFHLQYRGKSSVIARFFRVFLDFSEFEVQFPSFAVLLQSMSLNTDMKMIRSVNSSGLMFSCRKIFSESFE